MGRPASHPRLHGLDALRGLAALAVVVHHTVTTGLMAHAYLVVDFFFMLSGFVVAGAYEPRFAAGLSSASFMVARLRRLYPAIAVGIVAGAVAALIGGAPVGTLLRAFAAQLLFVPQLTPLRGLQPEAYPLDGVQWSLTLELLANLFHAIVLWRWRERRLVVLAALAFAGVIAAGLHYGGLGIGDKPGNLLGGLPRALFGYTVGILLHRLGVVGRLPRIAIPYPAGLTLLLAVPVLASLGGGASAWAEPLLVALGFPPLLVAARGWRLDRERAGMAARLGALSYPLYAVHLPALAIAQQLALRAGATSQLPALIGGLALAFTGAAWLARLSEPRRVPEARSFAPALEAAA